MALLSPGVQVSVVDESYYVPAEPGTLPMIFIVTAENKLNGAGSGTAEGTLSTNAGVPYLITSQRDLVDTFGDPIFKVDNNNTPIHGSELNEYGLQAAYSFLGVSNRAFVTRANIDLNQLEPSISAPGEDPTDGSYWLDVSKTVYGVQEWNGDSIIAGGQVFTNKAVTIITDVTDVDSDNNPKNAIGSVGDYAVVNTTTLIKVYYRSTTGWHQVGSEAWRKSWPTITSGNVNIPVTEAGSFIIDGNTIALDVGDTLNDLRDGIIGLALPYLSADTIGGRLNIYTSGTNPIVISGDESILTSYAISASSYYPPTVHVGPHTSVPEFKLADPNSRPTGSIWLKTSTPNSGAKFVVNKWVDDTGSWETTNPNVYKSFVEALYYMDKSGGGANLLTGELFVHANTGYDDPALANFKIYRRWNIGQTTITSKTITSGLLPAQLYTFTIMSSQAANMSMSAPVTVSITSQGDAGDSLLIAEAINNNAIPNVEASVDANNKIVIKHQLGGEMQLEDTTGSLLALIGMTPALEGNLSYVENSNNTQLRASLWRPLAYDASDTPIINSYRNGVLWYSAVVDDVDILVHNGSAFVGFRYDGSGQMAASPYYNVDAALMTDPNGVIVAATLPETQSDETPLVTGDVWLDTSDLDNYPKLYKFNAARTDLPLDQRWELVDTGDQTTENGILFADARYNTTGASSDEPGSISDLLISDYVDPDSPDPAIYPKGMMLFNLRRSGFNVKKYVKNYINLAEVNTRYNDQKMNDDSVGVYHTDRWVTESGNQEDGSGSFGYKAQRKVVVQALQAMVNSNQDIREKESRRFNLMACPGYPELIGEMVSLNYDRDVSSFIVGDTPFRLEANGTKLNNWANNVNLATEDNDKGVTTSDPYVAMFYPSGFTSDNFGNNVMVPASHMMLRTIALSDQVAYPWFSPAGTRRGNITNASSVGFLNDENEFQPVVLNDGIRDTLYSNNINPITFITGAGLVNFGQKTRQLGTSSLDRINVARLVIYLRSQLNRLAKPYIFEANDRFTRSEIQNACETLLQELVTLRAIYDFIVVCDSSNNTPARIDRSELYIDVAVEPVKAIEFIYIPMRLKNTGEIAGL